MNSAEPRSGENLGKSDPHPKIRIFSCGGTIDKVYFDAKSDFKVGEPQIEMIFREAGVTFDFEIESIMRKDSLDMTEEDRQLIKRRVEAVQEQRVVITHGTDTMPETAQALSSVTDKTIVMTGSMTPARFRVSDAEFNIGCAIGAVLSQGPGVYIAMNGRVFDGTRVRKNRHAQRFEPLDD
jgi:L-asparaginase